MISKNIEDFNALKNSWETFKSNPDNQKIRIRDAAKNLNVSEAELLSTETNKNVSLLSIPNKENFLLKILSLDKIMTLIRNDIVVHEKVMLTSNIKLNKNSFLNTSDDNYPLLNFNEDNFYFVFSEIKEHAKRELRSFQFFDICGNSSLKIYLKGKDTAGFDKLTEEYKIDYNYEVQEQIVNKKQPTLSKTDNVLEGLTNVKLFFTDNNLSYTDYYKLDINIIREVFNQASDNSIPLQIHGIGHQCIQYHRDYIKNIIDFGPWINVIDKGFNIHALEKQLIIGIIIKYTENNSNHYSIEFFDKNSNHVLGIAPLQDYEQDLYNIINNLGVLNESI
tara:strand:- start:2394 stop:3398 length:1005 start_codon:yes stop_codon:yes gene_type:complete